MIMTSEIITTILIVLLLIVISGFFSGSETAITASSARPYLDAKRGNKRAIILIALKKRMDRLIAAILLGNNFVNILASSLATSLLIGMFGGRGVVYATLIMTVSIVLFAEILPKTIAVRYADAISLRIAGFMRLLLFLLFPILLIVQAVMWLLLRPFGLHSNAISEDSDSSTDILRGAIEMRDDALPSDDEKKMLNSILDLEDVNVSKVMVHRREVKMLDLNSDVSQMVDIVMDSTFSRFPLFDDNIEEIIGVVNAKQLLSEFRRQKGNMTRKDVLAMAGKPWFVPETALLKYQLKSFQKRHEHFSVVVDEYGVFLGIVTLEDVLEEIVGNIIDESDADVAGLEKRNGRYIVDGNVAIRDLNRELGWQLPDDDATTIAGLVIHEARILPKKDQRFVFFGFRFKILKVEKTRILSLQITPPEPSEEN